MSPLSSSLALCAAALAACLGALWLLSVVRRDASLIDGFWAAGFALCAWIAVWRGPGGGRALLAAGCATLWALRLSAHLVRRNLAHGEDRRYAAMRARQGPGFWWKSLFTVFLLQGALIWAISLPLQVAGARDGAPGPLDGLGVVLFLAGFLCEAFADAQLERWRRDPQSRGKVLDTGLWRLSRHPNYFGNALLWWGLGCFGAAAGAAWTLCAPALMTFLLLKVSGVSLLEKDIGERRPAYADYVRRTSAFVPWPPRS